MEFWTEHRWRRSTICSTRAPLRSWARRRGCSMAAALKAKDRVRVYAVNPRYDEIMGVKSYRSVTNLPEAPDGWTSWCPTTRCSMSSRRA